MTVTRSDIDSARGLQEVRLLAWVTRTRKAPRVSPRRFEGACQITSYRLDEFLSTKLRALYQHKKGRDLFDLATALKNPAVNPHRLIAAFSEYMNHRGAVIGDGAACCNTFWAAQHLTFFCTDRTV